MIKRKYGGGAKSAKAPVDGQNSRAHLVLTPTFEQGRRLAELLDLRPAQVAILTDPAHLDNLAIYPGEEIAWVLGANPEFLIQLHKAAAMFIPGESFRLKAYAL